MFHDLPCDYNDSRMLSYFAACSQSSTVNANVRLSSFCSPAIAGSAPVVFFFLFFLGGGQRRERCSDFSFVRYPVMIILATKLQIWPCFAADHSISGDGACLQLSSAGRERQVRSMEDILCALTGGHQREGRHNAQFR